MSEFEYRHMLEERGDRVKLLRTTDEYTKLKPGDLGTVRRVSDGAIHVDWDSGSSLSLLEGEDSWLVVE